MGGSYNSLEILSIYRNYALQNYIIKWIPMDSDGFRWLILQICDFSVDLMDPDGFRWISASWFFVAQVFCTNRPGVCAQGCHDCQETPAFFQTQTATAAEGAKSSTADLSHVAADPHLARRIVQFSDTFPRKSPPFVQAGQFAPDWAPNSHFGRPNSDKVRHSTRCTADLNHSGSRPPFGAPNNTVFRHFPT